MMKIDDIKRKLLFFYNEQQNKNKAEESGDNKVDIQDLWGKQYEVTLHFTRDFVAIPNTHRKGLLGKSVIAFKRLFRKGTFYIFEQFSALLYTFESKLLELTGQMIRTLDVLGKRLESVENQQEEQQNNNVAMKNTMSDMAAILGKQSEDMDDVQTFLKRQNEEIENMQALLKKQTEDMNATQLLLLEQKQKMEEQLQLFDQEQRRINEQTDTYIKQQLYASQQQMGEFQKQIWQCNKWLQDLREDTKLDSKQQSIIYAYRYLLNREPENNQLVSNNLRDWRELRKDILKSPEYQLAKKDDFENQLSGMPYHSVCVDDLTYFFDKNDAMIPAGMLSDEKNWAEDDIKNFIRIVDCYFYKDKPATAGIFLDIGGNIGTTSIYCKLKLKPDFRFIAFEPLTELVKLFAANSAFNGAKDIMIEKTALSDRLRTNAKMVINQQNWGNCRLTEGEDGDETVETTTLDRYLEEHNIDASEIKYIWLDVEGHEPEVLTGAAKLYQEHRIPLCLEFNQDIYMDQQKYETMIGILEQYFEQFIVCQKVASDGDVLRPVGELRAVWDEFEGKTCDLILF